MIFESVAILSQFDAAHCDKIEFRIYIISNPHTLSTSFFDPMMSGQR